jgi:hypothetical protein
MPTIKTARKRPRGENTRHEVVLASVKQARARRRIRKRLVETVNASGIKSDTELLEYALPRVALDDDFAQRLIGLEGSVAQDIDLEF